jgi:hypothetical protein
LVGLGVVIGMSFSSSATGADPIGQTSIQLTRGQEVLLVDPTTRAQARSALNRWGRLAAPSDGTARLSDQQQSSETDQARGDANKLAGDGDPVAAAALLAKARANASSEAEKTALGLQQVLMLNTAGRADRAKEVAHDIGLNAVGFDTQQAALGTIEGLEAQKNAAP